jgi:short-subunit dehydrogenase
VTLVVLGPVETPYWQHNPGSREHVPATNETLMPTLSVEQAAATIMNGIAAGKTVVVKPGLYRALFLLNALAPGLVAKQLRRATRKA